jgi:hypothetical protein
VDARVAEDEAITIAGPGDALPLGHELRVEERAPAGRREGDHARVCVPEQWEDVALCARVSGVVSDHDAVEAGRPSHDLERRAVVARDDQMADLAAVLQPASGVEDALGRQLVPPAEAEHVDVVGAQGAKGAVEGGAHERADSRIALHREDEVFPAPRRDVAQAGAEIAPPPQAPEHEIDAALERSLDVGAPYAIARAEANAADRQAGGAERDRLPQLAHDTAPTAGIARSRGVKRSSTQRVVPGNQRLSTPERG